MDLRTQLQSTLGKAYTLERELGGGGMSRVFAAQENRLQRKVVIKVLSPELAAGVSAERFEREIRTAASLQQANIVPVLSVGEVDGLPYYTMPLVEGESLRHRLAKSGAISITEVIGILRDTAKALQFAHEHGVVHRDIKPDNVLLSGGTAVVTDFGIAKAISASRMEAGATLTQLGTSIGTPAYMSPEQAAGDPDVDHRADIYALGCMAYELLAGRPPFANRTPQRVLAAHMNETPQLITELRPDVPPELAALVMRCLEKEATTRPQTAAEVVRTLDTVTSGGGYPAMPWILLGGIGIKKALVAYAAAFVFVAILARVAITSIGLPDWVFPGALIVMALGLPMILFTGYVHHVTRRVVTTTPTLTPGGTQMAAPQGTMATIALKASPHVSWKRAAMGGVYTFGVFALLVAAFMTLRALGIGPAGSLLAKGALSKQDKILVADFRYGGGDSTLGGVVAEAVRTDLGTSKVISVVPTVAMAAALQRMQRPPATRVDLPLAREIAEREGAKAVVHGDLTTLGSGFLITLRLIGARTGEELTSFRETAEGPRDLIATIGKLTRQLRGKIGESLKSVHATPPLERVTTSSVEALRKYAAGRYAQTVEGNQSKAIVLWEEAVALDSNFGMAWTQLGQALANTGAGLDRSNAALEQAFRLRDRLPEVERYLTEAVYYSGASRHADRAKSIAALEAVLERDSTESWALNDIMIRYNSRREFDKAERVGRRLITLHPERALAHSNLINTLLWQGKVNAADSVVALVRQRHPDYRPLGGIHARMHWARGVFDSAHTALLKNRGLDSANAAAAVGSLVYLELLQGKLRNAERLVGELEARDSARGAVVSPLRGPMRLAGIDSWFRDQPQRAIQRLDDALARTPLRAMPPNNRPNFELAVLFARAGRPVRARAILTQYEAEVDTAIRRQRLPAWHHARAEIALAEQRPVDALAEFRAADSLPDGPANSCGSCVQHDLGRAYDLAGQTDSARLAFEAYVNAPDKGRFVDESLFLAGVLKRLGELYEANGEPARAHSVYSRFVELWKNADPELQPKVAEVRKRLARLKETERR